MRARKPSDLSPCTVAWLRPWLSCYWPRHRNVLAPCTFGVANTFFVAARTDYWGRPRSAAEGASFGTLFPACRGGRLRGAK